MKKEESPCCQRTRIGQAAQRLALHITAALPLLEVSEEMAC